MKKPENGVTLMEAFGWAKESQEKGTWIPACGGATVYKCPCGRPIWWHPIHGISHLIELEK